MGVVQQTDKLLKTLSKIDPTTETEVGHSSVSQVYGPKSSPRTIYFFSHLNPNLDFIISFSYESSDTSP